MEIECLNSREIYRNRWMSLREDAIRLPDGSTSIYSVVDRPDFALVIPRDGDRFHLVEQYRYPVRRRCLEFPQGTADETDPLALARRELAEETGFQAARWTRLGRLFMGYGMTSQAYTVWLAEELTPGPPALEHEEQDMLQRSLSRQEFEALIDSGELADAHTLAAYALLLRWEARQSGPR